MSVMAALVFAAQVPAAPAPDWRAIGEYRELVIAWDAAGLVRSGELVQVRIRMSPKSPTQADNVTSISRIEIRCSAGVARVVDTANFDPDGRPGPVDREAMPWEPIPKPSFYSDLRDATCPAQPERG